ncbi:MAG: DUF5615 family PIN-like protein [Candidatus Nanohaloarchaea archaeon]
MHTASKEDNLGVPDREQLRIARENDWILLTFDDDFLSLVQKPGPRTLRHRLHRPDRQTCTESPQPGKQPTHRQPGNQTNPDYLT